MHNIYIYNHIIGINRAYWGGSQSTKCQYSNQQALMSLCSVSIVGNRVSGLRLYLQLKRTLKFKAFEKQVDIWNLVTLTPDSIWSHPRYFKAQAILLSFGSMRAVPTFRLIQWKTSHASWMEFSKKRLWWFQASRSISCWSLVILLGSIWSRKVAAHLILGQMSSKAHNLSCKCFVLKHQSSVARLSKLLTTFQFC